MVDSDTIVVITGGTAGIGRAPARRFARDGARVAGTAATLGALLRRS